MSRRHRPRRVGPLHRLAGLARALGALTASGVLLIAAPAVMWRLVGWPLPDRVPAWDDVVAGLTGPLTQDLILGLIGALFWYTYALLVLSVAVEVVATAGGWTRPRLPTAGPAQALAAVLVGTVLAGLLTATARASTGPPTAAVLTAYARPAAVTAPADPTADAARPPAAANAMVPAGLECTVAPYDTLWSLAEDWLHGDGLRWREIWTLNQGRVQADGTALTNPDLLRPGWILRLPPDAQPPTPPMAPEGPDTTAAPHASGPATPPTTTPAPLPPTAPGTAAPAAPAAPGTFSPAPSAPGWTPTIPANPAPSTPGPAPHTSPAPRTDTPAPHPAPPGQDRPVRLPSGAALPLSLITALAAAVVAARLLRSRRRRVPTPPGQPIPTDPPLPLVVREILRASRPPTDDTDNPDDGDGNDDGQGPQDPEPGSDPDPVPASERHDPPQRVPAGPSPTPRPADAIPGPAEAGDLDGPLAELVRTGRLDLHGPGAPAAARALLVHVLAAHHSDHTAWPSRLIIPSGLADRLDLPHAVLDVLPQVTITATTQNALDLADREALRRARLAEDTTAASLEELRAGLPDEMIPTVLLVATVASADDGRLGALAHAGARVGLYLLTLDPTGGPAGDGQPAPPWHLTPAQTRDLLRLLADAADQPTPTTDSPPPTETAAPNPMVEALPAPPTGTPPPPDPGPPPVPAEPPADDPPTTSTVDEPAGQPGHLDRPGPRVRLMLFGRPAVHLDGTPLVGGLRTLSLEIAAHLAVHPSGVTGDRLAADLLPDQDPTRARNQAYRAVAALRDTLRTATGDPTLTPILNSKAGYRLNPAVVDVDVWEFDAALHAAGHAPDDPARVLALTRAVALATATPLGDTAYDWSAPIVADLEHRAVDTLADLADLLADDHPDRALAYLEQALALTPTVEDLYRHVMSLHAARGRVDAVRRTYQRLRDALDAHGLDVDPTPETQALLAHLTRTPRPTPAPATTGPRRIVRPAIRHPDRPST